MGEQLQGMLSVISNRYEEPLLSKLSLKYAGAFNVTLNQQHSSHAVRRRHRVHRVRKSH